LATRNVDHGIATAPLPLDFIDNPHQLGLEIIGPPKENFNVIRQS
jgi:hypothetical protein